MKSIRPFSKDDMVTGLNLWGTKLVVLSACDTGVGEVKTKTGSTDTRLFSISLSSSPVRRRSIAREILRGQHRRDLIPRENA
jgi:hypothetical protein